MPADPTSVACRARFRVRVSACLGAERGDSLIEVMVAALLVALIAAGALVGFGAIGHSAGTQRNEEQAATLAQQDQARLRGLTITQLSGTGGNAVATTTIDGTTYQVTSKSQFISGLNGASSCSSGGGSRADEVQTTSTVNWGTGSTFTNGGRAPVVLHGIITPSQGGSLIISATDQTGAGLAGVTATVTGPTTVSPLTTDSSGCAIFAGLAGGTYTVTYAAPPGYVDNTGKPPANWSGPVTSTQTATATPLVLAQDGAISATFTTFYNGLSQAATSDTFIASNTQMPSPSYAGFGTNNTFASTITSSTTLFPYAGTNDGYSVYAGGCQAEPPPAGQIQTAVVQPTATTAVVLPLPAMIVDVYAAPTFTSYDDPVSAPLSYTGTWTHSTGVAGDYLNTESTSNTTSPTSAVTFSFTGTGVSWVTVKGPNQGIANVSLAGGAASPVDTYNKTNTLRQQTVYTSPTLANGPHTLTITVTGTMNSKSGGTTITIDSFIVQNAPPLELIKPNVTVTETDPGCNNNKDKPPTQIIPDATQGALLSPGEPYGDYTVCADDGVNHNTATVANTNFAAGNVVNIYLGSGSPGLAGGKCP